MQRKLASFSDGSDGSDNRDDDSSHNHEETQSLQSLSPSEPCCSKDNGGQSVSASDIPDRMCDLHVSGSPLPSQMSPTLSMPNLVPVGLFGRFTNSLTRPSSAGSKQGLNSTISRSSQVLVKRTSSIRSSKRSTNTNNNSNNDVSKKGTAENGSTTSSKSFFTRVSSFRGSFRPNINPHGQPIDRASASIRRSPFYASFHLGNTKPKLSVKPANSWNGSSDPPRMRESRRRSGGVTRYSYIQAIRDPDGR